VVLPNQVVDIFVIEDYYRPMRGSNQRQILFFLLNIFHFVTPASFFQKPILRHSCFQSTSRMMCDIDFSSIKVAVLGGGTVGSTLAQKLVQSEKFSSVTIAARDPEKTTADIQAKGYGKIPVAPSSDTLASSDVIILATPGIYDDEGIRSFAATLGDMNGKVIIDATNPLGPFSEGLNIRWGNDSSGGEKLQEYLPGAKVYKSFNTIGVEHMQEALGKDMLIAGDPDDKSKVIVEKVVAAVGFKPFYVGPIRYARNLEAIAELWIHMAVPPLGGRNTTRNFWFSICGDP